MIGLPGIWRRHFLVFEAGIAIVSTLIFGIWFFFLNGAAHVDVLICGNRANIYRTTATISGSLLGFSIAVTSFVLNVLPSDRFRIVRESTQYPMLGKAFLQATWFLGGLTVTALICLIWDKESDPVSWLVIPLLLFAGLAALRVARTIWILEWLVKIVTKPQRKSH